jgi:hypothetical protein
MAGPSNLLSGQRRCFAESLERRCLSLLAGAGLRVALANVLRPDLMTAYQLILPMIHEERRYGGTVP